MLTDKLTQLMLTSTLINTANSRCDERWRDDWFHWEEVLIRLVILAQRGWLTGYTGTERVSDWLYWHREGE